MRFLRTVTVLMATLAATTAMAQTPVTLTISGNQATGVISLPGGISADLGITFENVVGLTPSALDVTVSLVNPLDLALLNRLPLLNLFQHVGPTGAFPVLLRIEPSAGSTLSFSGVAVVSLYTTNLQLNSLVPLALFKASAGGPFKDNTVSESAGSYRVCGSEGDFSEFLIVLDLRPINTIINAKFDDLQALLTLYAPSIPAAVASSLQAELTQARTDYQAGLTLQAITGMAAFSNDVHVHSGADIPDVWRANDSSAVDIAGLLRTAADTLKFSLLRKSNH
jgi:hypothetical protein